MFWMNTVWNRGWETETVSRKPGRKITKEMKGDERVVRRRKDERVVSLNREDASG